MLRGPDKKARPLLCQWRPRPWASRLVRVHPLGTQGGRGCSSRGGRAGLALLWRAGSLPDLGTRRTRVFSPGACRVPDTQLLLPREHGVCPPPPQATGLRGGRPGLAEARQCCTRDPWLRGTAPVPWWPSVRSKAQDRSGGWSSSGRHPISAWLWMSWWVARVPVLCSPSRAGCMLLRAPGTHTACRMGTQHSPLFADGQIGHPESLRPHPTPAW